MDREESTNATALICGGVRVRALLSIHPARSAGHPRRASVLSVGSVWKPVCSSMVHLRTSANRSSVEDPA